MSALDSLDTVLEDRSLETIWLATTNNYGWVTRADNRINTGHPVGVAAIRYDGTEPTILTANIEADRIRSEVEEFAVEEFDWYDTTLAGAIEARTNEPAAADFPVSGLEEVDLSDVRQPLDSTAIEDYRALGRETAEVLESVCRTLSSTQTEREVASTLTGRLTERAMSVPVCLVGGARRLQRHRHFRPTDEQLGSYAIASVCTRRRGLVVSATRTVAFDPPEWLTARHHAAARVHTTAVRATQRVASDDGTASDVFSAIQNAYDVVGYPDEWQLHHQGGAAGYASREWIATPNLERQVMTPMGYAWNPSVQGTKCEETVLIGDSGIEILTSTGEWPTMTTEPVGSKQPIDCHVPLDRSK
ncbi:M24 family metallopeptidase [Halocatena halophila]|uniref:M24 family metallopeptidase n=1 Tax=Halocatena halophila TaxID=2814576 RepID=UPI002ED04A0B